MATQFLTREILPGYEVSTDPGRLDVGLIHHFLSTSYWAAGRPREVVERSVQHSLCFGVYAGPDQVAFGRVITDRAVFAYLADVFVLLPFRGRGISKALVRVILEHPDVRGIKVFLLRTRDAHRVYEPFDFQPVPDPHELMGRYR